MIRCAWVSDHDILMQTYHDNEYGRKKQSDAALFEKLCLECFQAGLSWRTVLYKRDALREAFYGFDPARVAQMNQKDIERLMDEPRIIRNRRKIEAAVHNARLYTLQFGQAQSFLHYVYSFTDGNKLCLDLKKRGYRFIGETICTSFLMSVGAIEAHEPGCFLYKG